MYHVREKRKRETEREREAERGRRENREGRRKRKELEQEGRQESCLSDARESGKPVRTASESQRARYVEPPQ